jgi:pimeloyl-ACP methyl ester carboxylesterase
MRNETVGADTGSLDVLIGGADDGPALVLHHGTPSDATLWSDWDETARAHGLRLFSISRPGYATSTRRRDRTVADVAGDVARVLERYDVPWFVTAGWSGGGPHALATAALLGERCRAVATLAGVGPFGVAELDFLDGMGPENHAEFGAALQGETALRAWLAENAAAMVHVTGSEIITAFGGLIPQADKDVLAGSFADAFAATMRRALAGGFDGWIDDDRAFIQPWGFALTSIAAPVTVWQGDLDLMVPAAHGAWLAHAIPGAVARAAPGHGHISLITTFRDEIVADLVTRAGSPNPDINPS